MIMVEEVIFLQDEMLSLPGICKNAFSITFLILSWLYFHKIHGKSFKTEDSRLKANYQPEPKAGL